jgi:DeoR family fructose operon transcriptional repressor
MDMKRERQQELMAHLAVAQKLSLGEAMQILNVSESTARRMFMKLEEDGLAIRTHGGIQCINRAMTLYSFEDGARTNTRRKMAIARQACRFLEDGDVLFCDSGTTIQCFCAEMVNYVKEKNINVKVYTNSLANLELLSPHITVTLLGGEYRANRKDFCGYLTERALSRLYFSKSFVGADGCKQVKVFTTTDFETASMNEIAMRNSDRVVLLADSSKFSIVTHVAYAPLDTLHTIITDSGVSPDVKTRLEHSGVQVVFTDLDDVPQIHNDESV